jgi:hypothetical protein
MRIRHAALHEAKEQLEAQAHALGMSCTDSGMGISEVTMTGDVVVVGDAVHHLVEWCINNGYQVEQDNVKRLKCWSCKGTLALHKLQEQDGICPFCNAEIDLEDYALWLC